MPASRTRLSTAARYRGSDRRYRRYGSILAQSQQPSIRRRREPSALRDARPWRQPINGRDGRARLMASDIAVVVVNWNGGADTTRCLDSLAAGTVFPRVIVVDNGSTDDSLAKAKR